MFSKYLQHECIGFQEIKKKSESHFDENDRTEMYVIIQKIVSNRVDPNFNFDPDLIPDQI